MKITVARQFFLSVLILFCLTDSFAEPCREIVGYYAGWKWYKRNKLVNPESIDYSKYTIINYAFFKPLENGTVVEGDSWTDQNILSGTTGTGERSNSNSNKSSLVYQAHSHGLKVIASVGGWTYSSAFPAIASDQVKRELFSKSCIDLIRKYNLDGIDIDWEYPGNKAHNGTPADKHNFTLLLTSLREALDEYGTGINHKMFLTAAFGPAPSHMNQIEWDLVAPVLDIINLMSYNYYGAWDPVANHNTPLYKPREGNAAFNVHASLSQLIEIYNVPSDKITLGLAFYGRSVKMCTNDGLHSRSAGVADATSFPDEKGTPAYYNIVAKADLFQKNWDETAQVPYLTGKNGLRSFVSYDDPESIAIKAVYALENNLRGVVIWDIAGDYVETYPGSGIIAGTPLCDAVNDAFCRSTEISSGRRQDPEPGLTAFPNPFRAEVQIKWNSELVVSELKIVNGSGQVVFQQNSGLTGDLKLNTSSWTPGVYFISLLSPGRASLVKVLKL